MNIKKSLALQFSLIVACILLVYSLFVYQYSSVFRQTEFFQRLKERGFTLTQLLLDENAITPEFMETLNENNLNQFQSQTLRIYNDSNNLIYSSEKENVNDYSLTFLNDIRLKKELNFKILEMEYAAFTMLHSSRQYVVIIGAEDNSGNKYINNLGSVLSGVFILSLLISALTGWFFASQALTPFNNLLEEVDQITARNLDKRLKAVKNKDEIAHITNSFNGLLDRLENAFKLQKNFVSHASHEFRTPLTALKLQIEVALLQKRPLEEYIVLLKSLNEDINNLIDMQEGLNQLTKANAEIPVEKFEPIQMLEILMDAQSELVKGKPHFRIHVSIENFSDNEIRNSISGDYTLIKSALMNLMDNACKFSPDHSAEVTIIYLLTEIRIAIKDNGPGISDKDIDHIFEPFFRSEETRKITGHGIGLSLVKRITELHKGSISVKTAKDAGTTFTLRFPNRITNEAIVV